ncbi:MAG TPA: DUF1302 domain-containing protein [Solimonas sp.]|nr:DUF1302 domain-containing protein [Solimonas sp.]
MKQGEFTARRWALLPLLLAAGTQVQAYEFEYHGFEGDLDTTVSLGAAMRMEDADKGSIGIANGGTARSVNEDDGDLNYDSGDLYSAAAKATHDLLIRRDDYGLFSRFSYFYDYIAEDDSGFLGSRARERLGKEASLLDLYVYGRFEFGEHPVNVRAGKQVVNWGESIFIGNSINIINPVDVAKLRTPGAEIKEALTPTPILWTQFGLAEDLSAEAVWIAGYEKTRIDPRGSYFSSNDIISDDSDRAYVGFGRRNDQHQPLAPPTGATATTAQVWVDRAPGRSPDNTRNQYGLALRYLAEALDDTEFGLYYLSYHSRTPLISAVRGTTSNSLNQAAGGGTARYFDEYPEDIQLYGLSFNTGGPYGIALQGEYSYRPNQPLQLAAVELLLAAVGAPNNITGTGTTTVPDGPDADTEPDVVPVAATVPAGTVIRGYRRVDVHQLQLGGTKAFGPTFGASQFVMLGEIAVNQLDLPDGLLFAGPGTQLPAPGSANAAGGSFQPEGYADETSWGYRLLGRMDFEDVIGAAQLSPRLALAHDVQGTGPNFNQGTKALTLGLTISYLQRWQGDIGYTAFFGGRRYAGTDTTPPPAGQSADWSINANPLRDRDFLAMSVSYSF